MAKVSLVVQAMERNEKLEGGGTRRMQNIYVRWSFPSEGWAKINTDGASKGSTGQAGAGGIIRGSRGEIIGLFAANCGLAPCIKAELLAVLKGLALAWNKGLKRVILEVDSQVVTKSLLEENHNSSPYYHIIRRCKELTLRQE